MIGVYKPLTYIYSHLNMSNTCLSSSFLPSLLFLPTSIIYLPVIYHLSFLSSIIYLSFISSICHLSSIIYLSSITYHLSIICNLSPCEFTIIPVTAITTQCLLDPSFPFTTPSLTRSLAPIHTMFLYLLCPRIYIK